MKHYTYNITNIIKNKHYIGVRSNDNPITDLGIVYFSSSTDKIFIQDQKDNPQNYHYEILSEFETRYDANCHEIFLHSFYEVGSNKDYYNKAKQTSTGFSFEGRKHTEGTKSKMAKSALKTQAEIAKDSERYESRSVNMSKSAIKANAEIAADPERSKSRSENTSKAQIKANAEIAADPERYKSRSENMSKASIKAHDEIAKDPERCKSRSKNLSKAGIKAHDEIAKDPERCKSRSKAMSEAWDNKDYIECPHCDMKSKNTANMYRWHFDNCKNKGI